MKIAERHAAIEKPGFMANRFRAAKWEQCRRLLHVPIAVALDESTSITGEASPYCDVELRAPRCPHCDDGRTHVIQELFPPRSGSACIAATILYENTLRARLIRFYDRCPKLAASTSCAGRPTGVPRGRLPVRPPRWATRFGGVRRRRTTCRGVSPVGSLSLSTGSSRYSDLSFRFNSLISSVQSRSMPP